MTYHTVLQRVGWSLDRTHNLWLSTLTFLLLLVMGNPFKIRIDYRLVIGSPEGLSIIEQFKYIRKIQIFNSFLKSFLGFKHVIILHLFTHFPTTLLSLPEMRVTKKKHVKVLDLHY